MSVSSTNEPPVEGIASRGAEEGSASVGRTVVRIGRGRPEFGRIAVFPLS
ncbi:hypothetical protein HNR67_004274 [Crossiella cryophila]|uniref:Uncharacterized protein n=1 Tax=Crossiella cryophila TaxID=43355 RepID=A0A7W7FTG8_9PSEU|nr:hypothetical protein [Crossiella cryophila]